MNWDRLAAVVTGPRSWVLALLIALASGLLLGLAGSNDAASQSPIALPSSAEAARAAEAATGFPGGDRAPAILVVTRGDGAVLAPADLGAAEAAYQRMQQQSGAPAGGPPVTVSEDGRAALAAVPMDTTLSGFELRDAVDSVRAGAGDGLPPQLRAEVTGGPAFGADIAGAFSGPTSRCWR